MLDIQQAPSKPPQTTGWLALAEALGPQLAQSEQAADISDQYVLENIKRLKEAGFTAAGVPTQLGGGGASHAEMCNVLRILGQHCSSTALALSMHTHQVMIPTWKWKHQQMAVEGLLTRVAQEKIMLLSTGGADWLNGSGTATPSEGGFIINSRKGFVSGSPTGDLLITSAIYDDPTAGKTVLHFALPMKSPGVSIDSIWQAMGMRGTGSHTVLLEDVFVSEQAISLRRPANKWHPAFHLITLIAIPIIYSVYVGIAEAGRDLTIQNAQKRRDDDHVCYLVGGLENELTNAKLVLQQMIAIAASQSPSIETTNQIMTGRTLITQSVLKVVDAAMEITGGLAFHRPYGLEKLFRDAQGARYHPMREEVQRKLAGQLALGNTPEIL